MPFQTKLSPFNAPSYDVFAPSRMSDERGVVLGTPLDGGQSYVPWIGVSTIRELALKHQAKTGVVDARIHDGLVEELNRERALRTAAEARVAELEAWQDRINGLSRDGFKIVKKMGAPTKKAVEA